MAGYRGTFGENVDFAYGQRSFGRQLDIGGSLERGISNMGGTVKEFGAIHRQIRDLTRTISELDRAIDMTDNARELQRLGKAANKAERELARLVSGAEHVNLALKKIETGFGMVTKGIFAFNTALLGIGFDFVVESLKRVYELQERWAKAIGGFNMQLGGMTKGLHGATAAATKWSSTIRGLTNGDIQEGIQMFSEFTTAIGRVVTEGDKFSKVGIQLARGFNLGGTGAGQLLKVMQNIGESGDDVTKLFGADLVKAANQAGIPVNMLAKDIQDSDTYMARFGKDSAKTFIQGAAFARKFTITMKDLQNSVQDFDMFDNAADTAASLNTVFGTAVNAMDLMMEDDPAKRIEMIRQQFLMLGKTEDKMSPKEIRMLSQKLKLTEDQTRSLFSLKNAGVSYQEFQAKAAASEKEEANAKRNMELQLRKTAQTLFAFGAAFDRITVAIAKAISPILQVFGLAKTGGKDFKSFGDVMEGVTATVEAFFNSLAKNPKWMGFMHTLADDLIKAGKALKEFVMSGRAADMVGRLATVMSNFYTTVRDFVTGIVPKLKPLGDLVMFLAKHFVALAAAWGALKATNFVGSFFQGGTASMLKGAYGKVTGTGIGRTLGSAGLGAGLGGAVAGGTGAITGGIGGLLGGPIGAIAGAAIGWSIKRIASAYADYVSYDPDVAMYKKIISRNTLEQKNDSMAMEALSIRQRTVAARREAADNALMEIADKKRPIAADEVDMLRDRIQELQGFGKHTRLVAKALKDLHPGAQLSAKELQALQEASAELAIKTAALQDAEERLTKQDEADFGIKLKQLGVEANQNAITVEQSQLTESQKKGDQLHGQYNALMAKNHGRETPESKKLYKEILTERKKQEDLTKDIGFKQLSVSNDQRKIAEEQLLVAQRAALRDALNDQFLKDQKSGATFKGEDINHYIARYALSHPDQVQKILGLGSTDVDQQELGRLYGSLKMASGGVVTRPTRALIGESGPEAVIPLRAMARGRMNPPLSQGGALARNLVSGGPGDTRVVSTVADVNLDGQKVGSVVVQSYITGRR